MVQLDVAAAAGRERNAATQTMTSLMASPAGYGRAFTLAHPVDIERLITDAVREIVPRDWRRRIIQMQGLETL